jgi:serine protease Do
MTVRVVSMVVFIAAALMGGGIIGYGLGQSSAHFPETGVTADGTPTFEQTFAIQRDADRRDSVGAMVQSGRRNAITRAVAVASPAVVGINVIELRQYRQLSPWGDDPFFRQFFGDRTYTQQVAGLGSGFLISPDGYILTNDHVAGNAKEITITQTNGKQFKASLVGTDQMTDIALLKIEGKDFPYIPLGKSDDVMVGEWVIALGNPFGLFDINDKPTVTVGVVSNTGVKLEAQDGRVYRDMIQTDAAINSGNSGGPLVNALGEVIGVNSVIYTPNQGNIGLGFAIPINRVKTIVAELRRSGKIERELWTGLEIQAMDRRMARYFGLDKIQGVIVSDVKKSSPAERAGFRVGDIIIEAGEEKINDEASLVALADETRAGETLKMKVIRDRREIELSLRLEKRTQ